MGISLLTAFSFVMFGVTEWASRLAAIVLNVAILGFLYRFYQLYWDRKTAVLALFFVVFSPMFFYIRHLVAFELLALFFTSAILCLYATWQTMGRRRDFCLLLGTVALGTFVSDWQTYFLVPGIVAHGLLFAKRRDKKVLLLLPLAALSFLAYVAYVRWLTGSIHGGGAGGGLWGNMLLRMNLSDSARSAGISLGKWVDFFLTQYTAFYTPILGVFTILFFVTCLVKLAMRRRLTEQEGLILCCFFAFVSYFAVFSHAYMCCEFMNLFFLPVSGLFGATAILGILRLFEGTTSPRARGIGGWILVGGCAVSFLMVSYPKAKAIYALQNLDLPLNTFFAAHSDNIIVAFDEDAPFYQLRPYLQLRTVKRVWTVDGLQATLRDVGSGFGFAILKRGEPGDSRLHSYLSGNYPSRVIANHPLEEYDVFDLRSSNR
jgi:4-amino-4-deoxy-L-arabinose transferase-like glycosyltransferase